MPNKNPNFHLESNPFGNLLEENIFFLFNVIQFLNAFAAAVATKPFNQNVIELQLTADVPKKMTKIYDTFSYHIRNT